jgi:hypothetical protein
VWSAKNNAPLYRAERPALRNATPVMDEPPVWQPV